MGFQKRRKKGCRRLGQRVSLGRDRAGVAWGGPPREKKGREGRHAVCVLRGVEENLTCDRPKKRTRLEREGCLVHLAENRMRSRTNKAGTYRFRIDLIGRQKVLWPIGKSRSETLPAVLRCHTAICLRGQGETDPIRKGAYTTWLHWRNQQGDVGNVTMKTSREKKHTHQKNKQTTKKKKKKTKKKKTNKKKKKKKRKKNHPTKKT